MTLTLDNSEASAAHVNTTATGWARVGSASAPTNTTAGDLTAVRLFVPNAAVLHGATAQFTGPVVIPTAGQLRFGDTDDSHYIAFKAGAMTVASLTYTWPIVEGAASTFLQTDGAGTLIWAAATAAPNALLDGSAHSDTLAGAVVLGDLIHGNATPKWARLAGNITATKKFLNQTGTGAVSAVPDWSALVVADIPFDDATSNPLPVGTVADGTEGSPARKDHVHATGAGTPSTQAFGDAAATGAGPAASMTDHKHAMPANPVSANGAIRTITFVIDGGGSAITTGIKGDLEIPFACTINRVTLLADQSGSIVVDIWKDTYANYPPTVADTITAAALPTITTATKSQDATLTGWTTSIAAGDTLRFNVNSITTLTRVTLSLKVTET